MGQGTSSFKTSCVCVFRSAAAIIISAVFGVLLVSVVTSALRGIFDLSFWLSFYLALVFTLPAAWLLIRHRLRVFSLIGDPTLIVFTLAAYATYFWITDLQLQTIGNGDAAFHVEYLNRFINKKPDAYHGFTSYYTLTHLIQYFGGLEIFDAHYVALSLSYLALCMALLALFRDYWGSPVSPIAIAAVAICTIAVSALWLVPIHSQFMLQGGLAHCFGAFIPIVFVLFYSIADSMWGRLIIISFFVAATRFTYGLNLGDALFVGGVLALVEARAERKKGRPKLSALALLFSAAMLVAALYAYSEIFKIIGKGGASTKINLNILWVSYSLLILTVGSLPYLLKNNLSPLQRRIAVSTLSVLAVTLAAQLIYRLLGKKAKYYMMKYVFYSNFVAFFAIAAVFWMIVRYKKYRFALPAGLAIVLYLAAFSPYIEDFKRRKSPLVNEQEWYFIKNTIESRRKQFGGAIIPSWPAYRYIHARYGRPKSLKTLLNGRVMSKPGYCIFYVTGKRRNELLRNVRIWQKRSKGPPRLNEVLLSLDKLYSQEAASVWESGFEPKLELRYVCR
ncbi:MAG: hypothetical protein J5J00_05895 [Deltaproteobacteria bacterium]|nr:hypothetical protein [Deltaproteobacteria bacterium]